MSKLKQIREQLNVTQEEVAEKSGISVRTIQRIESGIPPKGYTLKALAQALQISEKELLMEQSNNTRLEEEASAVRATLNEIDFSKIKLINLSSILFVVIPPLNIIAPLLLSYLLKQKNDLTKKIVSLQILWTIFAPILFIVGVFLKLGHSFTLVLLIVIALSNVFMILRNLAEIDKNNKLRYQLNFNII